MWLMVVAAKREAAGAELPGVPRRSIALHRRVLLAPELPFGGPAEPALTAETVDAELGVHPHDEAVAAQGRARDRSPLRPQARSAAKHRGQTQSVAGREAPGRTRGR
jgi:hypothetical protein